MPLDVGCLVWRGPRDHTGVHEGRPTQRRHDEDEEETSDDWDHRRQMNSQVATTETHRPGGRVTNAVGTIFRKIFIGTRAYPI